MKKIIKYIIYVSIITFSNINVFAANAPFMQSEKVSCGSGLINNLPKVIVDMCNTLYNIIMVIVPIILIVMGIIDLLKGMMSPKEDEIKKGRDGFIKRTVMGLVIFLVVIIVKVLVSFLDTGANSGKIVQCVDCFISGECDTQTTQTAQSGQTVLV